VGNRTSITDVMGNFTIFSYDALNRLITKTDPLGNAQSYSYDGAGNRTSLTDANGNTIQYSYDGNSRLTDISYPDATAVTFSYDANANRTGMVDQYGAYTYQFDELDRMTRYTNAYGKTVSYSYDEAGNKTSLTYPDNKTVNYTYDPLNRMSTVTDWLGGTTYTYDADGNVTTITNPNGTAANNTYDNRNRLISIDNTKSDTSLIASYNFTLDAVGNHTEVIKNESLVPVFAKANKSYSYDNDNRLLTSNGTAYNYDANGNMTSKGINTYAYDYEDRLSQTSIGGVNTAYQYDGLGNRIAKVADGATTRYVLDISGALSQVLAETDENGTITRYYVYGLGLISKITPGNEASYYHYDSRGSTIALTDSTETITDKYAYDPFGKLANSEGSTANSFKYVGRFGVMDEGNGLHYMRARYYDPEIGRFLSKDSKHGLLKSPQTFHRYNYVINNPIKLIDPSGFSGQRDVDTLMDINASSISLDDILFVTPMDYNLSYVYKDTTSIGSRIARDFTYDAIYYAAKNRPFGTSLWPYIEGRRIIRTGNEALGFIKLLENAGDEFKQSNITFGDVVEASTHIVDNVAYGLNNPDALLDATTQGVCSTTAIALNTLSDLTLIRPTARLITKGKVNIQFTGENLEKALYSDWLSNKFQDWFYK